VVGATTAVRAVGLDLAVDAAARLHRRAGERWRLDGDGHELNADDWDGPDFWTFGLTGDLGRDDPEVAWDFVCRLIDAVAGDDERVLSLVGAGALEDFCHLAGTTSIDRIEDRAASNDACRRALGEVRPTVKPRPDAEIPGEYVPGPELPPEIYPGIRCAAGF
jgi:hypothetical protein